MVSFIGRFRHAMLALSAGLLVLSGTTAAVANNGLAPLGQGAKITGRAGAGVAVADDTLSVAANPALLTEFPSSRFDVSVIVGFERVRERSAILNEFNQSLIGIPLPGFTVVWDPLASDLPPGDDTVSGSSLRLAVGLYEPIALGFAPTFTVAWKPTETISVGFSLNVLLTYLTFNSNGSIGGGGGGGDENEFKPLGLVFEHRQANGTPIDPPTPFDGGTGQQITWAEIFDLANSGSSEGGDADDDSRSVVSLDDIFGAGLAVQAGMVWSPQENLSLGFSVRSPGIILKPQGTGKLDFGAAIGNLQQDPAVGALLNALLETFLPNGGQQGLSAEYDVSTDKLVIPATVAVGIAYWPKPWWLVTLDVRWIGWDYAFDEVELVARGGENADINEIMGSSTIRYTFPLKWKDQLVVAMGTSVLVKEWLVLRAGFNHGNNPIPRETSSANSLVVEDHVSVGATFYVGKWDLDFAYVWGLPYTEELSESNFRAESHVLVVGFGREF